MPNHARQRRSIRLPGYDYARPGAYFVTMVTQGRVCLLGDVVDGRVALTDVGQMAEAAWFAVPEAVSRRRPG